MGAESILACVPLRSGERLALITADTPLHGGSHFVLAGMRGHVRRIARQYLGPNLQPGTVLYDVNEAGVPVAACWSSGSDGTPYRHAYRPSDPLCRAVRRCAAVWACASIRG